jgi:hypothetical protein
VIIRILCGSLILLLWTTVSLAQPRLVDPGQKTVQMSRTDTPPEIDGVLDDEAWKTAAVIDDLHQVNPSEYAEPSERTEVYIVYDDDSLYIGARIFIDPELITANVLRQNGSMTSDDTFFVTLDPFNNRRGGYFFGINPNGVRMDGLYRNVSEYYSDWDTIFFAETGRFEGGWTVEYEIPFKSISFDPTSDTWGFNISRTIQSRNEDMAWVTRNRRWDPSSAGLAVGFEGMRQGLGLDVIPSASMNRSRTVGTPTIENSDLEPSLDLVYKLTSSLNASLTLNTDFSATEVDDRQVNLTRFSLFFPEKRDFFLREADIFEFGRIGAQGSLGGGADRQNGRPFFSRRIGLAANGTAVDLDYGGKVSGRVGNWEIGALSIRQDQFAGVTAETLSVVRAKAAVGEESNVGMMFTDGDPRSNIDNSVFGLDYLYRNSRFAGGRTLEAVAWLQESDTPGLVGDDRAAGIGISMPSNAGIRFSASAKDYERNFNPALGFMSRRGVRDVAADVGYTYRPSGGMWQSLFFSVDAQEFTELGGGGVIGGGLQTKSMSVTPVLMTSRTGDVIFVRSNFETEVLTEPFEIYPNVVIAPGRYRFENHGAEYRTAGFRKFAGRIAYVDGSFYNGDQTRIFGNFTWQPSPNFRTSIGYNITEVDLPQGSFTTRLITTGIDWVFSSRLSWVNLIQYDNITETAGINMRLHWIPEAGREIFFVINHTLEDEFRTNSFKSKFTDATFKASYTFRF